MHEVVQEWYANYVEVEQETLFELIPQYPATGRVQLDQFFRIQHVLSGYWLHYEPHAPTGAPPGEAHASALLGSATVW